MAIAGGRLQDGTELKKCYPANSRDFSYTLNSARLISMDTTKIIAEIDAQLAQLQSARVAIAGLASTGSAVPVRRGPGRPPKNAVAPIAAPKPAKRKLSAAGRARIAAAMKARWAAKKAIAAAPAKTAPAKATKKAVTERASKGVRVPKKTL
jgi:hypothetical protein